MQKPLQYFLLIFIATVAASAAAHRYFFSITNINVNNEQNTMEVIHQITAHDLDNAIAEKEQIRFSTEHPSYDKFVQQYIEQHFTLNFKGKPLELNWLGLEITRGNIYIYQESSFEHSIEGLEIINNILIDSYQKQVNTVNFQDNARKGSLTFTKSATIKKIDHNN